ncbi:MAG: hypothetical protein J0L78_12540 [Planctomycetes bacterium]|nr:hypothetical protein [Planctomycetota bacterium]
MTNYYHLRGKNNIKPTISVTRFRELVAEILAAAIEKDYLQQAIGYHCVDSGQISGYEGRSLSAVLLRKGLLNIPDPVASHLAGCSKDKILGLIEILHDLVSKGNEGTGYFHSFSNCGWHFNDFDPAPARKWLRDQVNPLLAMLEDGFKLGENGRIVLLLNEPAAAILDAPLPEGTAEPIQQRMKAATERFRRGVASWDDRRIALRDLADVLEQLRPLAKARLSKKDEADLFNILNNFAIRHMNDLQQVNYDKPIFFTWLFYELLAAIHACVRLTERSGH